MPNQTGNIPNYCFNSGNPSWTGSEWLKSFSAPKIESIGHSTFAYCTNLQSIDFPLVTNIENYAFAFCTKLTEVKFVSKITTFGNNVFEYVPTTNIDLYLYPNEVAKSQRNNLTRQNIQKHKSLSIKKIAA